MLYSRYGSGAKDVLLLPFEEGLEILITAQRMNNEEKLFFRWVVSYQTSIEYEEFKRKLHADSNNFEDDRTEQEILDSVKQILEVSNGSKHI